MVALRVLRALYAAPRQQAGETRNANAEHLFRQNGFNLGHLNCMLLMVKGNDGLALN